jgi:putative protease
MARSCFPSLRVHSSTQINSASARAVNLLSKEGVKRAVLARELCFDEIKTIRDSTNIELEVFVHGALCVSVSGLCLFSSFLGGKSANRGLCTQACRRLYSTDANEKGYFFSPRDLQLLEKIPDLARAGVDSFKIEGRMKSADYVGCVVRAYRLVLDAVLDGGDEDSARERAVALLKNDFAREKTVFHFDGRGNERADGWLNPAQDGGTGIRLGSIGSKRKKDGVVYALIADGGEGCETPQPGDSVRVHRSDDSERTAHKVRFVEQDADGSYWIDIPAGFAPGDNVYLTSKREISRRYRPVVRDGFSSAGDSRQPGFEKAPYEKIPVPDKQARKSFPEGVYARVSSIEDAYIAQSVKPAALVINASVKTIGQLAGERRALPFKPKDTVLALPAFFAERDAAVYEEALPKLVAAGYSRYMADNLAHISLLKNKDAAFICGPSLYTFNRYAASFLAGHGARFFVTPFENNRQNLERSFGPDERGGIFVTVFAYPPLFTVCGLGGFYDFDGFCDSRGERFRLVNTGETSLVTPEKAFSIVDKIRFLRASGFRRFIVDFSGPPLRKHDYKDMMKAAELCSFVEGTSRFNWKDGFFTADD